MSFSINHLEEPNLTFGGGHPAPDPKVGLSLYGPYSGSPTQIPVGIIGDAGTVEQVEKLLRMFAGEIDGPTKYPLWTQSFPGLNRGSPLGCDLLLKSEWMRTLRPEDIDALDNVAGLHSRIGQSVDLFCAEIRKLREREDSPQVFVCAPPRRMMDLCLPTHGDSRGGRGKRAAADVKPARALIRPPGQKSLAAFFPEFKTIEDALLQRIAGDNFHHFLKAKAMAIPAPTQFVRPYTLDKFFGSQKGRVQDAATLAWNLCVGLYYKAGGRPWKLSAIPAGTCFVGISFYKEKEIFGGGIGTSLAQVFTPEGEGLILRGDRFAWPKGREPHLSKEASKRLIERVIAAYRKQTDAPPSRVVVHKSSSFDKEERAGFKDGLGSIPRHDFVTLVERSRRIKLFRAGEQPPIRGTIVSLPDDSRLLYTRGYIPLFRVYPGARVPRPLEVTFDEISTSRLDLCREILGLTRLNWNSADFAGMQPITLQFSREVGKILREVPPGAAPETRYLYYM